MAVLARTVLRVLLQHLTLAARVGTMLLVLAAALLLAAQELLAEAAEADLDQMEHRNQADLAGMAALVKIGTLRMALVVVVDPVAAKVALQPVKPVVVVGRMAQVADPVDMAAHQQAMAPVAHKVL